jgi:hypothetical protein
MAAAVDWGSANATVLNNSWYWDTAPNNPFFWAADRHQDYLVRYGYDFVTVAAGNLGNGCTAPGGFWSSYVPSPAKGYNVMTVGNHDDVDTVGWVDDLMQVCSSFGDPVGDTFTYHGKPELSAVGSGIWSTLVQTDPLLAVGAVGSGTSYAAPMVAATAATMIEATPTLGSEPEAVKAILMATALHNVEGPSLYSDVDGAGGMVSSAAVATVERGDWGDLYVDSTTAFPLSFHGWAYQGERVRCAIVWLSNPDAAYTTDQLPADLDLVAFRADGSTVVGSSSSSANGFEIVEFVAPATEYYEFRVSRFGPWSGGATWLGAGWWRGVWWIAADTGYTDPPPTPLGTHLAVDPAAGSPTNYWRAIGIRPDPGADNDLELFTASHFDDPTLRIPLTGSYYPSGWVDLMAVDGNHWSSSQEEHYRVLEFSGGGGYRLSRSNAGVYIPASAPGTYGPFSMLGAEVVKVFDVGLWPGLGMERRVTVAPTGATPTSDLELLLFQSDATDPVSWRQPRFTAVAWADAAGVGTSPETIAHHNPTAGFDYYGLVVANKTDEPVDFYVHVTSDLIFADGFESGATGAWSAVVP